MVGKVSVASRDLVGQLLGQNRHLKGDPAHASGNGQAGERLEDFGGELVFAGGVVENRPEINFGAERWKGAEAP